MDAAVLVARLLLAAVFVVAGIAKLADRKGSRRAITDFGVPDALAAPLGVFLPLAELAVATALVLTSTALWGAVAALALLLLFVAGIGVNLARGRRPDCHCFGQIHSAPAGWKTLARNGVLAVIAALLVWRGFEGDVGPSVIGWIGSLTTAAMLVLTGGMVVLALLTAQWVFLLGLLRQNGRLLARLEAVEERLAASGLAPSENEAPSAAGLPVGVPAPTFSLEHLHGEEIALDHLRARGKPVMLVFTDPSCGPCVELLPELGRWQHEYGEKLTIVLVGRGSAEENSGEVTEHGVENVLLQEDWEVADAYEVEATPSAVVVSPEGTIGSPVAQGPDEIEELVARAVGARAQLPLLPHAIGHNAQAEDELEAPKVGEPAPELRLPNLAGNEVSLDDFRGEETLVLFWSPDCGFCQEILPDLKEWEAAPPEGAPRLLVVSDGTVEDNEATGLRSPIVLDHNYAVSDAFGVDGTPSAVLVDADGNVASERVDGALAVLDQIRSGPPEV
jgi:thiol-disulfide isomerase/thioredoxin/uncharacterized membrane protein YphA (DoxX/SURF4 family)